MVRDAPMTVVKVTIPRPNMASMEMATSGVRNAKLEMVATDPARVALSHSIFADVNGPIPISAMAIH